MVGGHYWTPTSSPDPWISTVYGSGSGSSAGSFVVSTGYDLSENDGHAVVVHSALDGSRIGCGTLGEPQRTVAGGQVGLYPGLTAGALTGSFSVSENAADDSLLFSYALSGLAPTLGTADSLRQYPGSTIAAPTGKVNVADLGGGRLEMYYDLSGLLDRSSSGGVHIHAGTSCDAIGDDGAHFYESSLAADPWRNTTWVSDAAGIFIIPLGYFVQIRIRPESAGYTHTRYLFKTATKTLGSERFLGVIHT